MQKQIDKYQKKFRVLNDWKITFLNDGEHYSQSSHNIKRKIAIIYPFFEKKAPNDYILHEVLHIAFQEAQTSREKEEMFVQDICHLKRSIF